MGRPLFKGRWTDGRPSRSGNCGTREPQTKRAKDEDRQGKWTRRTDRSKSQRISSKTVVADSIPALIFRVPKFLSDVGYRVKNQRQKYRHCFRDLKKKKKKKKKSTRVDTTA